VPHLENMLVKHTGKRLVDIMAYVTTSLFLFGK
jgi:hypothetical protein